MKIKSTIIVLSIILLTLNVYSQALLNANGPGSTYELINSVLAPGYDVVENPECVHPEFGRHIAEVWDSELNQYVFEFYSHVTPDNDRCIMFDRQRIEIKTYDQSPANLIGVIGETITYKWKFKLPVGFKPTSNFTHIHQIKPVGGDDGDPLFTLTPRKGSPNKMELIHNNTTKVAIVNLSLFEGVWVECKEVVNVGAAGSYSMVIKKVSDGTTLLSYNSSNIMTIRSDNNFIRPKWGIYRSKLDSMNLRDEAVRFASFYIAEETTTLLPNAPTSLTANATATSQINLNWTDNSSNEEQFRIERSLDGSTWSYLATVAPNSTSFYDTALTASTIYYYHIRSENTFGNSLYSNSAIDTTFSVPVKYSSTGNSALWSTQVWSPSGTPKAIDTVVIAHDLTLDTDVSIAQLNINPSITFSIASAHYIYGNILINGTLSISNATTVTMNGNINCTGSTGLLKFTSNGGRINNTGINKIFSLSNGATFSQSNSTTYSSTPLSYSLSGMNWNVDNSLALTSVIYNISGNTVVTSIPNSQSFGNLKFTTTTTATTSRTITISENLNILGDLTFATTYNATLNSFTWNFGVYSITTTGVAKSVSVTQSMAHPIIITGTNTNLFNGFSSYSFKPPANANCKVIYGSNSSQVVAPALYQFLTISGGGTKSLSANTIVSDSLILAGGRLVLGSYHLTLGSSSNVAGSFSTTTMIVATGSGELRKEFSAIGTFTFPLGDTSGTAEYSPVTITINSASAFSSGYVGTNLIDAVHPNNSSGINYLSRYWKLTSSGIINPNYIATFTYVNSDINGTEDSIYGGRFNNGWTNLAQVNSAANSFTAGEMMAFGDFTGGERNTFSIKTLNLTVMIEGLCNGTDMILDTVAVELHNVSTPWALVEQANNVVLNFSGNNASVNFYSAVDATNYYIAVKHRNGLQTWSASGQSFSGGTLTYDFTSAATQAYNSNMILVGSKWCMFSGDVTQDGYIDIFDDFEVYNDSYTATYRLLTDLNLDAFVDIFDDFIVYNNSYIGVSAQYPGFARPGYLKKYTKENIDIQETIGH